MLYGLARRFWLRSALVLALAILASTPAAGDFVTIAQGAGSKWDDRNHGTPAVVTWGFMLPGTTVDPGFDIASEVMGGSDIAQLRSDYDAAYGAGAFDAALQRAFSTWSQVADIAFVGPIADSGLPVGSAAATSPDIRVGAFQPVGGSGFAGIAGVGFGPPGDDLNFPDALAGDVMFNLAQPFIMPAGDEDDPILEIGNDLENLFLHELGHAAMGLAHPAAGPGEVMYVGANCCDVINRFPSNDDIEGAETVYGPAPACRNGLDDDGDGLADLADPGCDDDFDDDERSAALPCDNGLDDDDDGRADFDPATFADPDFIAGVGDPGCMTPDDAREDPKCQNGVNDDNQLGTDFDGGESIVGVGNGDPDGADPFCAGKPWRDAEKASKKGCGIGFGAVAGIALWRVLRVRRRRAG